MPGLEGKSAASQPGGDGRRGTAAFVAAVGLLAVLLLLSAAQVRGAPQRGLGIARCAVAAAILALGAFAAVGPRRSRIRGSASAFNATALAAAGLALIAGVIEVWTTAWAGRAPPALAGLGLARAAWLTARPRGLELSGLIVVLALCVRGAYDCARTHAARAMTGALEDARGGRCTTLPEGIAAAADAEARRAIARAERGGTSRRDAATLGVLDIAAQTLWVAAPAFAAFALVSHALLAGGPLSPAALLAPIAVLAGCSPAAFRIAAPVARALAIARARAAGVLVRDARALERVARADVVCFLRTGTVTSGTPRVTGVRWCRPPDRRLIEDILALERHAKHPAGAAIASFLSPPAIDQGTDPGRAAPPPKVVSVREGDGLIAGRVRGNQIEIGALPRREDLSALAAPPCASVAWFLKNGEPHGYFELHDALRGGALEIARALWERGIGTRVLSGDRRDAAAALGGRVGMPTIGGMSAASKALHVRDLQHVGARVLLVSRVGAACEAQPDVSIGVLPVAGQTRHGRVAIAPIVLLDDRLHPLTYLVDLSRALRARLREGTVIAALFNAILIPSAALGICPPAAAAALALVEALVVLSNALRLPAPLAPHSVSRLAPHPASQLAPQSASRLAPQSTSRLAPYATSRLAPHSASRLAPHSASRLARPLVDSSPKLSASPRAR